MIKIIKAVIGYEGLYDITNDGVVFSVDRYTVDGKHLKRKEIKGGKFSNGYEFVCLRKDGVNHNCLKHRLVAEAFIPNDNLLPEINHIDGDKFNNTVENLEWCTQSYNIQHAYNMGLTTNFGEKHKDNKLTRLDVIWIREHYKKNSREFGSGAIARKFNVSDTLVRDIIHHKKWKHV